jgi:hypothetical protein
MEMIHDLRANPRILAWLFKVINDNGKWRKMNNAEKQRFKTDLNWLMVFDYYDFELQTIDDNVCRIRFPDSKWFKAEFEGGTIEDEALDVLFRNRYGDLMGLEEPEPDLEIEA